jgi:hypothetical protein
MLVSRRLGLAAAGAALTLATAALAQSQAPGFDARLLMLQPMSDTPDKVIALVRARSSASNAASKHPRRG